MPTIPAMTVADLDVLTRIRSARDKAAERERHFEAQRDDAPLAAAVHVSIHAAIRATLDDILDPGGNRRRCRHTHAMRAACNRRYSC